MATTYEQSGELSWAPLEPIPEAQDSTADEMDIERPIKRQRVTYDCDVCKTTYTEKRSLLRHQRTPAHLGRVHQGPALRRYVCRHCDNCYTRNDNLQRHVKEVHKGRRRGYAGGDQDEDINLPDAGQGNAAPMPTSSPPPYPGFEDASFETNGCNEQYGSISPSSTAPPDLFFGDDTATTTLGSQDSSQSSLSSINSSDTELRLHAGTDTFNSIGIDECNKGDAMSNNLDDSSDRLSVFSVDSLTSTLSGFRLSFQSGLTSSTGSRNPRFKPLIFVQPCPLCGREFGKLVSDRRKVQEHIETHLGELNGNLADLSCLSCRIDFVHINDLKSHLQCVDSSGTCGFDFEHKGTCTGHHPPSLEHAEHEDHCALKQNLWNWENAQLASFRKYISDFSQGKIATNAPNPGDIPLQYSRSTGSIFSTRSYITCRSVPFYIAASKQRRVDNRELQQIQGSNARNALSSAVQRSDSTYLQDLLNRPGLLDDVSTKDMKKHVQVAFSRREPVMLEMLLGLSGQQRPSLRDRLLPLRPKGTIADFLWKEGMSPKLQDLNSPATGLCVVALLRSGLGISYLDRTKQSLSVIERPAIFCELAAASKKGDLLKSQPMATVFCTAAYVGKTDLVGRLLDLGMDVNTSDGTDIHSRCTALLYAARDGHVDLVERLLSIGADLNATDSNGWTALFYAARGGHVQVVERLVSLGADPARSTWDRDNPLSAAISSISSDGSYLRIAEFLLRTSVKLEVRKPQGRFNLIMSTLSAMPRATYDPISVRLWRLIPAAPLPPDVSQRLSFLETGLRLDNSGKSVHILRNQYNSTDGAVNVHTGCNVLHCRGKGVCEKPIAFDSEDGNELAGGRMALANIHCPECREYYTTHFEQLLRGQSRSR